MEKLRQLIKNEILKEIKVYKPYIIASPDYKKFYQMVELNGYWNIDWKDEYYEIDFNNLNEFDIFYLIYRTVSTEDFKPDRCIVTSEKLEEDPELQQKVVDAIKKYG